MASPAKSSPRDAQVMGAILKEMGVTEYEPRVVNVMLEFVYRYVTDILEDAKVYSNHANKKLLDAEDIKLAVQCRMDHSFTSPPPRDLLMEISKHKNGQVLPLIKTYTGLRLPPDRYCLSAPNYKMSSHKAVKKHQARIQIGLPQFQQRINLNQMSMTPGKLGPGGPHLTVVSKPGMTVPAVTIVTKPSGQHHPVPKPAIRISTGPSLNSLNQARTFQHAVPMSGGHPPIPQPTIQFQPLQSTTTSLISGQSSNPLKRKMEDEDYDNPS
ncbi:transcription initiation factor TFIID subunit 9B-like [Saccostrea echinata]|uniref:transcription initiation factor TFIID subunit 9B-like n=1 Tax=Saccostrea echinata TaxID=191078 RepID=UPI002A812BDD|nr:transcription initiation factor TFIID subunit 9B-like [Saccostrea echinata]XP_061184774.1 transcription initiation factor TFIID subunit 9B-like [Saccostrea echinata]